MTTNKSTQKSNVYDFTPRAQSDLEARLRAAFQAIPEGEAPSESCPAPEKIWAAVHMELPQAERRELVDHLASCPFCAEDWRIAWQLSEEERKAAHESRIGEEAVERMPTPDSCGDGSPRDVADFTAHASPAVGIPAASRRHRWQQSLPQLAAAAALLAVAVGAGVILQLGTEEHYRGAGREGAALHGEMRGETGPLSASEGTLRGEAAPGASRSLLEPGEALERQSFVLRWTAGPPGSLYQVRLLTKELEPVVVERDLTRPELRVPPEALEALPSGARLFWQVETSLPGGKDVASDTFEVVLR
jgi:hypothetical protein